MLENIIVKMSDSKNESRLSASSSASTAAEMEFLKALDSIQQKFDEEAQKHQNISLSSSNVMMGEALRANSNFQNDLFMAQSPFACGMASSSGGGQQQALARNSTKTLKCPKCNWHYKYQETLEIHMKEKHADAEVICMYCVEGQPHPKLARGETYSCGYKPYRCDLCKYSTTTKGNLSIHMQSDKHLHAVQEMPHQSISASLQAIFNEATGSSGQDLHFPAIKTRQPIGGNLQCLICLNFSADTFADIAEHINRDRQMSNEMDISVVHNIFQCLLCPYSTALKANFQLHTRTDKHIQRVQLINHMREGNLAIGFGELSPFARLSTFKSTVNVRCNLCRETFSCSLSLREHCESEAHLEQISLSFRRCSSFSVQRLTEPLPSTSNFEEEEEVSSDWLQHIFSYVVLHCRNCDLELPPQTSDSDPIENHCCDQELLEKENAPPSSALLKKVTTCPIATANPVNGINTPPVAFPANFRQLIFGTAS